MRVKNWNEFQHFKDRTPPWIKLYRYLLDDPDWHELSDRDAKLLIMIWLVASEDKNKKGNLPDLKKLAFRLRISPSELETVLGRLNNWIIQDDIKVISGRYQDDAPEERRGETETEERQRRGEGKSQQLFDEIYSRKDFLLKHSNVSEKNFALVAEQCVEHYKNKNITNPAEAVLGWFKREWKQPAGEISKTSQTAKGFSVFGEIDRRSDDAMGGQGNQQWPEKALLAAVGSNSGG